MIYMTFLISIQSAPSVCRHASYSEPLFLEFQHTREPLLLKKMKALTQDLKTDGFKAKSRTHPGVFTMNYVLFLSFTFCFMEVSYVVVCAYIPLSLPFGPGMQCGRWLFHFDNMCQLLLLLSCLIMLNNSQFLNVTSYLSSVAVCGTAGQDCRGLRAGSQSSSF